MINYITMINSIVRFALMLALLPLLFGIGGCDADKIEVISLENKHVAPLNADDVVKVMMRSGFSDEQILELGTKMRNSIAFTGAAKIVTVDSVEAIFATNGRYLHVSSRLRGSFIYDVEEHAFH